MATPLSSGKRTRSSSLSFLLWWEAFIGWGIPLILVGTLGVFAVLGGLAVIAQSTGILAIGCLILVLLLFFLLRALLPGTVEPRLRTWVPIMGVGWLAITGLQLYFAVYVGNQVFTGAVTTEGESAAFSLEAPGSRYDLVIAGNFVPGQPGSSREAGYKVLLEKEGKVVQEFAGVLSEHWGRQRVGRRATAPVRQLHDHELHPFVSPGEGSYVLKSERIDAQLAQPLTVLLYRDTFPQKTFWVLSALLLLGAYWLEKATGEKEQGILLGTATAVAFVMTFSHSGAPPHTYQNLIGAAMIAVFIGPVTGWIFRLVADALRKKLKRTSRTKSAPLGRKGTHKQT
jgi:hypothetical protein